LTPAELWSLTSVQEVACVCKYHAYAMLLNTFPCCYSHQLVNTTHSNRRPHTPRALHKRSVLQLTAREQGCAGKAGFLLFGPAALWVLTNGSSWKADPETEMWPFLCKRTPEGFSTSLPAAHGVLQVSSAHRGTELLLNQPSRAHQAAKREKSQIYLVWVGKYLLEGPV